jgi:hypothetical protein
MRKYLCVWRGKRVEIKAETTYRAQIDAAIQLGVKRTYEVAVFLMTDNEGNEVQHATGAL